MTNSHPDAPITPDPATGAGDIAGSGTTSSAGTSGRRPHRSTASGRQGGLGYSPCLYFVDEVTGEVHPWGYSSGADPLEQDATAGDDLDQGW